MSKHTVLAFLSTLAVVTVLAAPVTAQVAGTWVYAVNFECGYQQSMYGVEGYEPAVKMGNYATKIDIHNPLPTQIQLSGNVLNSPKWPALGAGSSTVSVTPQPLATISLAANNSLSLDCADLAAAWGLPLPDLSLTFGTGVATIYSETPLAIWVTKTSEVCAGLVATPLDPATVPLFLDDEGNFTTVAGGPAVGRPIPSLFGCPSVNIQPNSGPILQPGGMGIPGVVVPGVRPPGMVLSLGSTFGVVMDVSVSHSIDSEQVTGIFIPEP